MFQFPEFASNPYGFKVRYLAVEPWSPQRHQTAYRHPVPFRSDQGSEVGCPIRKSTDQSLFAAPHGLSQRITSFIACACQGIHQLPLRHLIVLIANAHGSSHDKPGIGTKRPASRDLSEGAVRLTHHLPGLERPWRRSIFPQHPAT